MERATDCLVPLIDLKAQYRSLRAEIDAAIAHVLERGQYVRGAEVEAFEEEWARYCGVQHCVAVSSGTDAIYLALRALGELEGYEKDVWAPAYTFMGTIEPVFRCSHSLYLLDVDDHGNMLPVQPTSQYLTRFVLLPVALHGRPVPWVAEAVNRGYPVVEDLAQGHGIRPKGTAGCFSFYPTKNLGAMGQAGAVVTNDSNVAEVVLSLREHGEKGGRFRHQYLSGNYRMDELQAAILRVKLPHLDRWNGVRRLIAGIYNQQLSGTGLLLPDWDANHVWHIYPVRTPHRDELAAFLAERGIGTGVRYPIPVHQQPAVLERYRCLEGPFPNAEAWARETLSLPIYPEMTMEQLELVIGSVKAWTARLP